MEFNQRHFTKMFRIKTLIRLYIILCTLFITQSCAGPKKNLDLRKEKDLVEKFAIEKTLLERFQEDPEMKKQRIEEEIAETKEQEKVESSSTEPKKKESIPSIATEPGKKIIHPPKMPQSSLDTKTKAKTKPNLGISQKEKAPKNESPPEHIHIEKTNYPKDYPERFKQYDSKFAKTWEEIKPVVIPGEVIHMDLSYFGVTVGTIYLKTFSHTVVGGKDAYHFKAKLVSAPFYRMIYELEDHIESFVDQKTFLPIKYSLIQRESGQDVDDLQLFDDADFKTHYFYKRLKDGETKKEEKSKFIPRYFQDSFSALYFARSIEFEVGKTYEYPVVTRSKVWLIKIYVEKIEKISTVLGEKLAYKLKAETRFPGVLSKKGDIIFWFAKDEKRAFLKFEAKVKIGTISGHITNYINQ